MTFKLPRIYPITDRRLTGISHAAQVGRLIAAGARFIQLREKDLSGRDFCEDAAAALKIAREHSVTILINDRVDIALALGADGVHVGQDDLPPAKAREILGPDAIIGFSTHSIEQALPAAALPIDYIAIGPVFQTSTKENPDVVVGLSGLRKVRAAIGDFPLVAIGGIDPSNFGAVLESGANSAAIISGILRPADTIESNYRRFAATLENC